MARALAAQRRRRRGGGMSAPDEHRLGSSPQSAAVSRAAPRRNLPPVAWSGIVARRASPWSRWSGLDRRAATSTSSGAIQAAITAAVPIALAGLSGLWSERAGVVNIGIEGMMILGTFGAGYAGYQWGPWAGVFFGIVLRAARWAAARAGHGHRRGRPHHLRRGDQHPGARPRPCTCPSCCSPTRPAAGSSSRRRCRTSAGSPCRACPTGLGTIEDKGWFFISDLAGILRGCTHQPVAADGAGRRADRAVRVRALADQVRAAAAVGRRGALRGGIVGRQRVLVQVHRGDRSPARWPGWPARSWWSG